MNPGQAFPRVVAGVILVAAAGYFLYSTRSKGGASSASPGSNAPAATPSSALPQDGRDPAVEAAQKTVYAMLDAAQKGDVAVYTRLFAGDKGKEIADLIAERGAQEFGDALRRTNSSIKGIVLHKAEKLSPTQVRMRCEILFIDHNEMQEMTLEDSRSGWRIVGLTGLGSLQMLHPYGSQVFAGPEVMTQGEEGAASQPAKPQ